MGALIMDYGPALASLIRSDLDFVIRSTAWNYTFTAEQICSLMIQVPADEEGVRKPLPHLVSRGFLDSYKVDSTLCRKFILPVDGDNPVWMYRPCSDKIEPFPTYKKMVFLVKSRARRIEEIGQQVSKATGYILSLSDVRDDQGRKYNLLSDGVVLIDRNVSFFDLVYIHQILMMEHYLRNGGDRLTGSLAMRLLNSFAGVPIPVDLDGLDVLPAEKLFVTYKQALHIYSDTMWVIAKTFSFMEIRSIIMAYKPEGQKRFSLPDALRDIDPALAGKLRLLDGMTLNKIMSYCKTGRLSYTPVVIL